MTLQQQVVRSEPVKQIASRIVNECLRVKADEQVNIYSFQHTTDYASSIALEVEKAGGVSQMILETDMFFWGYLSNDMPEAQYTRKQRSYLNLIEETDAQISLGGPEDPSGFLKVSGERMNKMFDGEREIGDRARELKIRSLGMPIGLITPARAKTYGFDYNRWRSSFSNASNVDHKKMSVLGGGLASRLEKGSKVRLTAANGTDLRFNLAGRPVHVRDGILDDKDIANGTLEESLPSGMVEVAPDADSVQGRISFDQPTALRGKMLQGLTWEFKDGRLLSYNATGNLDVFKTLYEEASGDKDRLANLVVGLNPNTEPVGFFTDRTALGTVSIGIGGNKDLGGTNQAQFGHEQVLRKPTLEVDGQKLVVEGKTQS